MRTVRNYGRRLLRKLDKKSLFCREGVELAAAQKLLFLCDRKACAKCSYPQCKHTPDLKHARNFAPASFSKKTDGVWVEQEWNTKCKEGVEAK